MPSQVGGELRPISSLPLPPSPDLGLAPDVIACMADPRLGPQSRRLALSLLWNFGETGNSQLLIFLLFPPPPFSSIPFSSSLQTSSVAM